MASHFILKFDEIFYKTVITMGYYLFVVPNESFPYFSSNRAAEQSIHFARRACPDLSHWRQLKKRHK